MKLLNKITRILLTYAIIVLLISIPVFYFIIEQFYYKNVDNALQLKKKELVNRTKKLHSDYDIKLWLAMENGIHAYPMAADSFFKDSIYLKRYVDTLGKETEPYRELQTILTINGKRYRTTIRRSLVESEDLIVGIAEAQAVLLVLLFSGWIIINQRISKKIWQPFEEIILWLKRYEVEKMPEPAMLSSGILEFDSLNNVVTELVHKNHNTFINQRVFIENASHEMQTPVAIIQSKIDLLLESLDLTDTQSRYMQSLYEAIERLNHLNKSLILLSQIENSQFAEKSPVLLNSLADKILEHLESFIDDKSLAVTKVYNTQVIVNGDPTLIEICISNLLTNAVNHTPAGGEIQIHISTSEFCVMNSGAPLQIEPDILCARFGKGKKSPNGVGLGLAIIKEIAGLMHWEIGYNYADNHRFILKF